MQIGLESALRLAILLQAAFLLWRLRGGRYGWLLGLVLGVITTIYLHSILMAEVWPALASNVLRSLTYRTLPYLIGPALYLHTLANLDPAFRLRPRHFWHLVPYVLSLPYSLWVVYQPAYEAWEAACRAAVGVSSWQPFLRLVHLATYLLLVLWLVIRYGLYGRMARLLFGWIVLMYTAHSITKGGSFQWISTISATGGDLGLLALLYAITYPQMRWNLRPAPTPAPKTESAPESASTTEVPEPLPKYARSGLRDSQSLYQQVLNYLQDGKRFRNPALGLAAVAKALHVPTNQVSQAVNEHEGSFLQVLNRLRVTEAQLLLRDPAHAHLSVLGIGLEAGFQTKSTFYAAFKRHTGLTPQAYRTGTSAPAGKAS